MKIAFLLYQFVNYEEDIEADNNGEILKEKEYDRNEIDVKYSTKKNHPKTNHLSDTGKSLSPNYHYSVPGKHSSGGVERYVSNLSKTFCELGHEVHIFCHKIKGTENKMIIFHKVPSIGFWSPLKIWSFAIASLVILKLRKGEFDIVHSFGKTLYQDVLRTGGGSHFDYMKRTYPLMENTILRFVVILNPRHFFNLLLEWTTFRLGHTKRIVCNSGMCKNEFVNRYRIPVSSIDVIYNGVDTERFSPINKQKSRERLTRQINALSDVITKNDLLALFVGSGFKRKGLKYAVESLSLLDKTLNVRLVVAGRGRIASYQKLAKNLGVLDRVVYLGSTDKVIELYDASDIFLFPTEYDAFPNVCLEAMSMGLPVIVSRSSGIAEIIDDGADGFVTNYPINTEEIAKRIELLANKKVRKEMGERARKKALSYSIHSNAEKTLKLYDEILGK